MSSYQTAGYSMPGLAGVVEPIQGQQPQMFADAHSAPVAPVQPSMMAPQGQSLVAQAPTQMPGAGPAVQGYLAGLAKVMGGPQQQGQTQHQQNPASQQQFAPQSAEQTDLAAKQQMVGGLQGGLRGLRGLFGGGQSAG